MAAEKLGHNALLAALYDGGVFTPLFETEDGAVVSAFGMVGGQGAYAVCQKGEALSAADVGATRRTLRLASETGNPVVTFYNSPGVQIEDGLRAMAAVKRLNGVYAKVSGVVPQIAVVTGVCGASSALAAAGADICIMTRGAELFLSAPFLAGDGGKAAGSVESAVEAGVVNLVAEDDADAVAKAVRLLNLLPRNNLAEAAAFEFDAPAAAFPEGNKYTGMGAIEALCDGGSAIELFAGFGDGVITALCTVDGNVTGIAATNGPDTKMGTLCCIRAARFMRLCDAYSIPVVTVLNSGGFVVSSKMDEAGMIRQAGRLAATYADATTAQITVLVGRTFGPQYTAMGGADLTIAAEGSVTAPVESTAAVSVLYKAEIEASGNPIDAETAARAKAYEQAQASAAALYKAGLANFVAAPAQLRGCVATALDILSTKRAQRLPKKHGNMSL